MTSRPFGAPLRWIGFFILLLAASPAIGQVIYYHNFGTTNITSHPYTVAATTLDTHLSGSSWSNSLGAWSSGNGAVGEAIRLQGNTAATITLTFGVATNYKVDIDSFSFWRQRSNTGWSAWSMTINGINVGSGTNGTAGASTGTLPVANPVAGLTGTVTVVISVSGQTGNGTLRIDDFTLNGSVTPNCTAATISSVSPTTGPEHTLVTLTGSGFLAGSGTSAVKFNGTAAVFTVVSDTEIRAYVPAGQVSGPITVVTNGCEGIPSQTFTSIVSVVGAQYSSDIYISEVYDAEVGDGGIIEIYNGTASAVDLSAYTIRRYADIGDPTPQYTFTLSGILPPGGIFLIGIGNDPLPCPITENQHYATGFNQNDEFELVKNGTVIDNVYAPSIGVGYSVIRDPAAQAPKPLFNPADWTTLTTESCLDIGLFTPPLVATPTVSAVSSQVVCEQASVTFSAALSNPAGYTFQWKMLNASGVWVNVPASAPYSGSTTATLTISPTPITLDNAQFYCSYSASSNGTTLVSNAAQLDVNPGAVVPTFTQVPPICAGGALSPLPTTSNNGITGSWSPALDNTSTTVYTFTPTTGQCATTATMTITVNPNVTPTFTQVPPICAGGTLSPLPTTSNNGITGSWSPALDNTSTTVYTFTPNTGQCATTATMTITVNPNVTPTFTQVPPICAGGALSPLPTTSNNGITGSWSPALDNTSTTVYTFTPNTGQCATTATMTITVNPGAVVPTFTQVPPICAGSALSPLPTTSNNGITGSWSPALDNTSTTIYTFTPNTGQCATTAIMTITVNPNVTPTFTQVPPICAGGALSPLPTTSNNGITGSWSPALDNTSTTVYTFTPTTGQCATTATMTITVNPGAVVPTFTQVPPICAGGTLSPLPTTSNNGITGSWSPALNNSATTVYTFTPNTGQCATTATMTITVNPNVTPSFTQVPPICAGGTLSPLPTTSNNGITGSWSPALDNTSTTIYTFTPNMGQCATTATMTITVNPGAVVPTFTQVPPICAGGALSPLPTTSNNGITGSWSPALDNTSTTVYSFTPTTGQCATTATMTITVNPNVTPTFTQVPPICAGGALSPLPTTSNNGITGSWSPALNNSATTVYTFTPNTGQCATTAKMTITVNPNVTPTFTQVPPICAGGTLSALPTTSNNGITGSWSPALDNTSTTIYTFTPNTGQCATTATMTITVNPNVTPTFTQVPPICAGGALSALPTTSNNGITGSWSPALNNSATTVYTFTPNTGQCATTATMTITVNPNVTPTFTQVPPICAGGALSPLPTTSNNGITGSWSPALDNTSTTVYTFTPTTGQCATTATMTITVNPGAVVPTFTQVPPICAGGALSPLPTTSNNGITGSWSPALNNSATTVYTFTPNTGQCATMATMTITVNPNVTPTFTQVPPICAGGTLSPLPTTSNNGITGSWSPALNNSATTVYTFTPNTGQCATTTTMTIAVLQGITPTFSPVSPICYGEYVPLPERSLEGILGSWSPAPNNEITTVYTFTPAAGQCAVPVTLPVTVIDLPYVALGGPYYLCLDNVTGDVISTVTLSSGADISQFNIDWYRDGQLLSDHTPDLSVAVPGVYKVTITDRSTGCTRSALTQVGTSSIAIASATVGRDFNDTQFIEITVTGGSGDYEYLLEGGNAQDSNIFGNIYEGEYEVSVRDKNGCGEVRLLVYALNYPRYFTPNGDGTHDFWTINGLRNQSGCQIYIFDRYGKLLAATRPAFDNGWDGNYNGHAAPADDYWFTCDYLNRNGQPAQLKAHFSLKR